MVNIPALNSEIDISGLLSSTNKLFFGRPAVVAIYTCVPVWGETLQHLFLSTKKSEGVNFGESTERDINF